MGERLGRRGGPLPAVVAKPLGRLSPWSPAELRPVAQWPMQRWTVDSG